MIIYRFYYASTTNCLDTETTGLDISQGHRIIEIGCVELIDRKLSGKHFHKYINPRRKVDPGAFKVHGISDSFLIDKPFFEDIVDEFLSFISGADLIIHNAHFDVGFINNELKLIDSSLKNISEICSIIDSLKLARDMHPGQKNSLDAFVNATLLIIQKGNCMVLCWMLKS